MTITVTHRGTPQKDKLYTTSCRECTSSLTFHKADTISGTDRNETFYSLTCPVCRCEIYMTQLKEVIKDENYASWVAGLY